MQIASPSQRTQYDLPNELIYTILSYLNQKELLLCVPVCKLFAEFARSVLYIRIELCNLQSPKLLNHFISFPYLLAYVQHVSIVLSQYRHSESNRPSTFAGKIRKVLRLANNIQSVSFTSKPNENYRYYENYIGDDVKDISACGMTILLAVNRHENLRSVELRFCDFIWRQSFVKLIEGLGQKCEVKIRIPASIPSLPRLIDSLQKLISVEIYGEDSVKISHNWASIASTSLKTFAIDSLVLTSLPTVESLKLAPSSKDSTMAASTWEAICQLPSLKTLHIQFRKILETNDAGLETFSSARFESHRLRCLTLQSPASRWNLLVFPILNVCKGLESISLSDKGDLSHATQDDFRELWSEIYRIAQLRHFRFSVDHLIESYGHSSLEPCNYSLQDILSEAKPPPLETITIVFPSQPVTLGQCQTICDQFPRLKNITFRLSQTHRTDLFDKINDQNLLSSEERTRISIIGSLVDKASPCLSYLCKIYQDTYLTLNLWLVRRYYFNHE